LDFETRAWVPHSGWPISKADLDPYYLKALPVCEIGPYSFDARTWKNWGIVPPAFNPEKIQSHFWQNSPPTRFGQVYREELKSAENITVLLNANVTHIRTDDSGEKVTHVDIGALNGKKGQVRAKFFVLACGGVESPRLLLISNHVHPEGLGNKNDLVGRFFMDHPTALCGKVEMANVDYLLDTYTPKLFEGIRYRPGLKIGEEEQRQKQVLNICATFRPEDDVPPAIEAGRQLLDTFKEGEIPEDLSEKIRIVMSDLDDVAEYASCRLKGQEKCTTTLYLRTRQEQAPNPNSRVTLSEELDALGIPRLRLDWRFTELERKSLKAMAITLGSEFGRLNIGRVQLLNWLAEDGDPEWISGSHHHMGTTRMADSPRNGVVNKDCRVHGIENLYVAGSSVFPTSGFVNPTLTLVALALRLADHLSVER
jgi:choline dehydrogenase-like flavoprotein